jgi:hypothetical protein
MLDLLRPLVVIPHLLRKAQGLGRLLRSGRQVRPVLFLVLAIPGGFDPAEVGSGGLLLGRQVLVPVILDVGPMLVVPLLLGPAQGLGGLLGLERELGPLEVQEVRIFVSEFAEEISGGSRILFIKSVSLIA